ncbi:MAG: hypothetical protein EOO46_16645 [Flavobacterium sp.]|nr:MAG: hypothetical protein EOO46_16645 [Flavobacterium sp.]
MISKNGESVFLYKLFTFVEAIAFFAFLYYQLVNRKVKKIVIFAGIVFLLLSIFISFVFNGAHIIDSVQIGVETIFILVFSFYYMYERMNDTSTLYVYSTFSFWTVTGMVLYLSGSFFIYIFADSLPKADVHKYWIVTNILSILKNLFFTIVNSKPTKKISLSDYELSSLN